MALEGAKPVKLYIWDVTAKEFIKWTGALTATVDLTEPTDFEGAPVTVGTSAVEMTFAGKTQSIKLRSSVSNTGTIYLGKSNVTNAGANAMDEILPSEDVTLELNDSSNAIYLVSDTASQTVYKIALL